MNRDELIAIVRKLQSGEEASEAGQERLLRLLEDHFEHSAPSDLIFWPNLVPGFDHENPSAEEIVDFGLSYRRRIVPREELVRLVQAHMETFSDWSRETSTDDFYLMSENLRGYELNHLCLWGKRWGLGAAQIVDLALGGQLQTDPDFQKSLAETMPKDDE
jgi:hypothetical protein